MMLAMTTIPRNGFMFVLSSPSGAGKTTIARKLLESDDNLEMSVSVTTREKRPGEEEGTDYYFTSQDDFVERIGNGDFLEHAEVFGNFYGTPEDLVDENLQKGTDVLFDIDWQGTEQLNSLRPDDVVSVFILPPSLEELESRLRKRAQDSDDVIAGRMAKAQDEISHWNSYDYVVVNNDVEDSLNRVKAILQAERQKRDRQTGLTDFVEELVEG